jgi:hypothetical protein
MKTELLLCIQCFWNSLFVKSFKFNDMYNNYRKKKKLNSIQQNMCQVYISNIMTSHDDRTTLINEIISWLKKKKETVRLLWLIHKIHVFIFYPEQDTVIVKSNVPDAMKVSSVAVPTIMLILMFVVSVAVVYRLYSKDKPCKGSEFMLIPYWPALHGSKFQINIHSNRYYMCICNINGSEFMSIQIALNNTTRLQPFSLQLDIWLHGACKIRATTTWSLLTWLFWF